MTSNEHVTLTVRDPADLIAAVPYLIGFHPADSIVVVGLRGASVAFAARTDLPAPATSVDAQAALAAQVTEIVDRQRIDAAVVVGYGPAETVTPALDQTTIGLQRLSIPLLDALRVTGDRYWSYYCHDVTCCPLDGRRIDSTVNPLAVAATVAGQVALPDRAALQRQVEPVTGTARESMRDAAGRARARYADLIAQAPTSDLLGSRTLRRAGETTVRRLLDGQRRGVAPTDDDVAWLVVLLTDLAVRDFAWEQITDDQWQVTFWQDVLRRAEPEQVAAPASLLAFAAWRAGNGALARVSLDRVLAEQPDYSMARLMDDVLTRGIPPAALGDWPKPSAGRPPESGRRSGGSARGPGGDAARRRPGGEARDRARPARQARHRIRPGGRRRP
ncbi:DUF4192 domain-containing protein [Solwaraspora sp. WMMB335]|uniref:DUF4192 domain-containing protein n=1 Tax=Solwaraspora sp. WMMB335 TaxID=3404118 RepID=UPI003B933F17